MPSDNSIMETINIGQNDLEICVFVCERYTVTITAHDPETVAQIERESEENGRTVCEEMREELLSEFVLGDFSEDEAEN
jgi:hypothetical protein